MEILDRIGQTLKVQDDCAFEAQGRINKGYIYKITDEKVYVTFRQKDDRPFPDAHMHHNVAKYRILKL